MSRRKYRIGVDVGGTNTDCVLLELGKEKESDRGIISSHKTLTTVDVTDGIATALRAVLTVDPHDVVSIAIGTTHFVNAIIEADPQRLSRVAVIRLGAPYTAQCLPFADFPPRLTKIIFGHYALLDGGLQIDGKEIRPIDASQIALECKTIRDKGIKNVVVVGVFSPLAQEGTQEHLVESMILQHLGSDVNVVCSAEVGPIGLLERENAAILNCSILSFAKRTIKSYYAVLSRLNITGNLFLTQLDGTLLPAHLAAENPIRTFANGPTNSMRGAAFLAGMDQGKQTSSVVVADIGGTTTDVGVLLPSGFPRKAAAYTEVGGVRTNFSMPDIHSIGLGGGSRVRFSGKLTTIGPDSVGSKIEEEALVFRGSTLTVTDVAIASGTANGVGDASRIQGKLTQEQIGNVQAEVKRLLENAIDKMKTNAGDVSVLLVGGGSIIIPPVLKGVKEVIQPPHFSVANAVGAAISRVSGEVDKVVVLQGSSYEVELERCKDEAIAKAVAAGADVKTVAIAEVAAVELPYVSNQATRIVVKAVGDLNPELLTSHQSLPKYLLDNEEVTSTFHDETPGQNLAPEDPAIKINIEQYKPHITKAQEWIINELDLEWIAEGCAVLGCGGGGAPYPAYLMVRQILREGGRVRVVDDSFFLEETAMILPVGFMGSPSVSFERIPAGTEIPTASEAALRYCEIKKVAAVLSTEIGGKNGVEPMRLASSIHFDCPLLDGDLMGRAYPRMNQIVPCVYSKQGLAPAAGADGVGNCVIVPSTIDDPMVETLLRSVCTDLGSAVGVALRPMSVAEFRSFGLSRSTSFAWWVGRAIAFCRKQSTPHEIPRAILEVQNGAVLFVGKISDVQREVRGGFTWGTLKIVPLLQDEIESSRGQGKHPDYGPDSMLVIPFQNENLSATLTVKGDVPKVLCSVPDLIAVLDSQSGSSIGTQDYRYGLRVTVIGIVGNPRWQTKEGLKIGGPEAFSMDINYQPISEFREILSVIKVYSQ